MKFLPCVTSVLVRETIVSLPALTTTRSLSLVVPFSYGTRPCCYIEGRRHRERLFSFYLPLGLPHAGVTRWMVDRCRRIYLLLDRCGPRRSPQGRSHGRWEKITVEIRVVPFVFAAREKSLVSSRGRIGRSSTTTTTTMAVWNVSAIVRAWNMKITRAGSARSPLLEERGPYNSRQGILCQLQITGLSEDDTPTTM